MASEAMVENFLKKSIKGLTFSKFGIEQNFKERGNMGVGYLRTADHHSLIAMIKLHYTVYAGYRLRTYIMGFAYDDDEEKEVDYNEQRVILKLGDHELRWRHIVRHKL